VRTHESTCEISTSISKLLLFHDKKLGIREILRKTGLPYGTLYRLLKDPFKIDQPRGYPAYLSTSEIESGTISQAYAKGLRKTLKDDFDVTFASANSHVSSARVASLTEEQDHFLTR
jgi:hypothetical protein